MLKMMAWMVEVGLRLCAAGGSLGRGGGKRGVAGERCVPSTLVRWEWKEDVEMRRDIERSASAGVKCPELPSRSNNGDASVASSSSALGIGGGSLVSASESVKPR